MVDLKYAENVYLKVTEDYNTDCFTQAQLAERYRISLKAVAWCTQYYGFHNTKAQGGKKPIYELEDLKELVKLL